MDNHKDTTPHHNATAKNRSMSDTDDEFHSPLRSPLQPDDVPSSPSKAIVPVDKYYTSFRRSPISEHQKPPQTFNLPPTAVAYNRSMREEPVTGVTKVNPGGGEDGGERRSVPAPMRRLKKDVIVDRVELGFRVIEIVFCIIAFAVMASDKTEGWSGDSFDRYKEYRYVVAVNAMAFAYAAFQAIDLTYLLKNDKHMTSYYLRPHFDFLIDQILAYLLISASSSAATRVDDWVSNWGKDDFTQKATASVAISFLAFLAFAISSIISGYNLCNHNSL
ncbi:CASP-like protein 4A3 [Rutidosis leptorrhynchoides]|uniref:CASP-like protein 4A3 n=1 Tax=Rutidosis leptorrhynchoides TaxID=125765 RepID=UPI003A9A4AC1